MPYSSYQRKILEIICWKLKYIYFSIIAYVRFRIFNSMILIVFIFNTVALSEPWWGLDSLDCWTLYTWLGSWRLHVYKQLRKLKGSMFINSCCCLHRYDFRIRKIRVYNKMYYLLSNKQLNNLSDKYKLITRPDGHLHQPWAGGHELYRRVRAA